MPTPEETCFVVLNYRRPWNIPEIVNQAIDYGFGDVLIWDNSGDSYALEQYLVESCPINTARAYRIGVTADGNRFTMGRYAAVLEMSDKKYVATCDDDYLVTGAGWDRMFQSWDGRSLVAQLPEDNNQYRSARRLPYLNLGYGGLFHVAWAKEAFWAIDEVTDQGSRDILVRKADRCFTTYHRHRVVLKAQWDVHLQKMRNPDGTLSEMDEYSIHLQPEHLQDTPRAISIALQAQYAEAK